MASVLRRRAVVVPSVAVIVVTGGGLAWAQQGDDGPGYRTALVTKGDVTETLSLTGTVSVVDQAKAATRTSGTVAAVHVVVGQKVAAGQALASLDTRPLQDAVTAAKATLATARATLETDSADDSSTGTTGSSPSPSGDSPTQQLQRQADRALQQATRALASATTACAAGPSASPSPTGTPATSPSTTSTPTPTSATTVESKTAPSAGGPTCAQAMAASLAAQQQVAKAQQALAAALRSASTETPSAETPTTDTSDPSAGPQQSSRGGGSYTSRAARITQDTAAVAAAEVALSEAEKDLAAAVVRAPIAGTVATLPWTVGGTASPGVAAVVIGRGAVDVTVQVPSASIRSVKAGLPAEVKADGGATTLKGVVTRVGLVMGTGADGSSSGTYPVTVRVASGAAFVDGASAAVGIQVTRVTGVVTVPNSALRSGEVTVLEDGKAVRTRVQTGAKGALVTEVTSGVSVGQQVVLADLSEALPTSSTSNNRFGGGPQLGVNGGPPAGFVPGGGQVRVQRG